MHVRQWPSGVCVQRRDQGDTRDDLISHNLSPCFHQSLLEQSDSSLVLLKVSIDFRSGIVQLVDAASGEVKGTLPGDTEPVTALAFSPSGKRLYSASRSLQQQCWDVSSGTQIRAWKGHRGPILAMDVDPTGSLLATASADASCRVWDTEGFYCTHSFTGHRSAPVSDRHIACATGTHCTTLASCAKEACELSIFSCKILAKYHIQQLTVCVCMGLFPGSIEITQYLL